MKGAVDDAGDDDDDDDVGCVWVGTWVWVRE